MNTFKNQEPLYFDFEESLDIAKISPNGFNLWFFSYVSLAGSQISLAITHLNPNLENE